MAYKKGQDRRQRVLFPDCIDEYVEADAPVRLSMLLSIISKWMNWDSSAVLLQRQVPLDMILAIFSNSIFTQVSDLDFEVEFIV